MIEPQRIEAIGDLVAIVWSDGAESYYDMARLRAASPSAETTGERDLLGRQIGGHGPRDFSGVVVTGWRVIGGYAIQFDFSDGHNTGLYGFDYLRQLAESDSVSS
ncbi:MAG: DUF971 domain-containing protein [Verrucomicrobiales bacterium]|nr:DUF971 domain-containing protein [Verrucomicrobiales bacterium]